MSASYEIATRIEELVTIVSSMTESCILPQFDLAEATRIARERFGLEGWIKPLDGERDLNFLIDTGERKFVLKIANVEESPAMLECQHEVFERISEAGVFPQTATVRRSLEGNTIEIVDGVQGEHACRVLPFIEGRMLNEFEQFDPALLDDLGRKLGRLDSALEGYTHPALERPLLWDMAGAIPVIDAYRPLLRETEQDALVGYFTDRFSQRVLPRADQLRRAVIHNDVNRGNVVVDPAGRHVLSVIDFGDMIDTWLVAEVAIAACYIMLDKPDPLDNAARLISGYHAELALRDSEIDLLFELMSMRLCMSVCICAHQRRLAPDNDYLSVDERDAWALLAQMRDWNPEQTRDRLRAACS
jgi:Ser/Thr protein kinase RdoA (MazF antagonist)